MGDLGPVERPDGTGEVYPVTEYSCIEALLDSQPYVQQVDADPATPGYDAAVVGLLRDLGKGSCMGVPVVLEGRVWGELFATRYPGDRPYGREDLDFAGAVAGQIAAGAAQVRHLEQVARLAYTDELTGLANRRAIEDRLDAAIARHRATGSSVSLIIADVNGLKRINDDRGHEAGDRALVHVSGLLSASAGLVPGSLAGRLSGDEFCIVLEDVAADHAVWVAEDLCRRAKAGLDEGVACGVASTGDPVGVIDSRKRLFRLADAAQSRAKRSRSRGTRGGRPRPARGRDRAVRRSRAGLGGRSTIRPVAGHQRLRADARGRAGHVGPQRALSVRRNAWSSSPTRWPASSTRPPGGCPTPSRGPGPLVSVGFSAIRVTAGHPSTGRGPDSAAEQVYDLDQYPATAFALDGGSIVMLADDLRCDPAELAILSASGYAANLMAGARDSAGGGWLVEVFTDEISAPVVDLGVDVACPGGCGAGPAMTEDVDRLGSLARLARSLVAARSEAEVARVSAAEARFAFGADAASVGRLEPERGLVRTLVNAGDLAEWEDAEPVDETYRLADFPLLAAMVEDVQPWVLSTADPAGSPEGHALLTALGRHSGLAVPGAARRRRLGRAVRQPGAATPPRSTSMTSTSAWRSPAWCRPVSVRSSTTSGCGGWRTPTPSPGSATDASSRSGSTKRSPPTARRPPGVPRHGRRQRPQGGQRPQPVPRRR